MSDEVTITYQRSPRWPGLPSGPMLSVRDVAMLDLARHVAMCVPFSLDRQHADTNALWDALKVRADEMGVSFDDDPGPALDALEAFALTWAQGRGAQRAAASVEI